MTTRKITAFLMCPAANGDALGGTPAASAASGGHIKKGAWMSVHEAALLGLAEVIAGPLDRALPYCYENKADRRVERAQGPEEFGAHRLVLVARIGEQSERRGSYNNASDEEEEGLQVEPHGLLSISAEERNTNQAQYETACERGDVVFPATKEREDGAEAADEETDEVCHGSGLQGRQPSFKEQCEFQHTHALERGQHARMESDALCGSAGLAVRNLGQLGLRVRWATSPMDRLHHGSSMGEYVSRTDGCSGRKKPRADTSCAAGPCDGSGAVPRTDDSRLCSSRADEWYGDRLSNCKPFCRAFASWRIWYAGYGLIGFISGLGLLLGAAHRLAPVETRARFFSWKAGEFLEARGVMRRHEALTLPVVDGLLGDA